MKVFLNLCSATSLVWLVTLSYSKPEPDLPVPGSAQSLVRNKQSSPAVFSPLVRSKALQYFDTLRSESPALPSGSMPTDAIGRSLNQIEVTCGTVVPEKSRGLLVDAPQDLLRVFQSNSKGYNYYLAGDKVVALDQQYKVFDIIRIPALDSPKEPAAPISYAALPGVR